MDKTTPSSNGGVADATLPQDNTEAEQLEGNEQVVSQDENGTPTLTPITDAPTQNSADEAASNNKEAIADAGDDLSDWAKKQGIDFDNPTPEQAKQLAKRLRDTQQKMHEATEAAKQLETAAVQTLDYTGDANYDELAQTVNQLAIQNTVRDFFTQNPEAKEFEAKMAEIVTDRPHLKNDLDALYALARSDPNRESELKQAGGREALQNLAQKQQQQPPSSGATNSSEFASSSVITPQNVYELVDKNDQAWFEKNHDAISKAIAG